MSAKWEKLEGNVGVLTIEVDAAEVNAGLDEAFKKVVKKVNVPGFRKGKLPRPIFEKQFGVEALYQDALDIILPVAYSNAVEEAGITPVDRPEIDIEQMEKGKNLIFTAKVVVKPEVKLGEYKGLEATILDTTVSDEDVAAEITKLQQRGAELVIKEEGTVENGDTTVIDFEGFVDGVAFEGGKGSNYPLEIGSGSFIPGFEEQLIGLKAGESKDVEVSFPEEYHAPDLAGKPATFKVTIHEIKNKELPELNDEFVKDLNQDGVETLEQLRTSVREKLEGSKKHEAEHALHDSLVDQATANAEIDVPEAMIETEIERMVKEFDQRLSAQGMNLELYYQYTGSTEETLQTSMRPEAESRVRVNLVLEAIADAENLEATETDVEAELTKIAEQYGMDVNQIKTMLPNLDALKEDLKLRKAVEFLVANKK
ncbi:MAG: tig [Bacillales bacterium]|jgi:trigger factor|nr:tig [Bacillales bacterium]